MLVSLLRSGLLPQVDGVFALVEVGQGWERQGKGRESLHSPQRNGHSSEPFFSHYKSKMQLIITLKHAQYR